MKKITPLKNVERMIEKKDLKVLNEKPKTVVEKGKDVALKVTMAGTLVGTGLAAEKAFNLTNADFSLEGFSLTEKVEDLQKGFDEKIASFEEPMVLSANAFAPVNTEEVKAITNSMTLPVESKNVSKVKEVDSSEENFNPYQTAFIEKGTEVKATADGTITLVEDGKTIIKHKNDGITYYSELTGVDSELKKGDKIEKGKVLGQANDGILKFAVAKSYDDGEISDFIDPNLLLETSLKAQAAETYDTESQPSKEVLETITVTDYGKVIEKASNNESVDPIVIAGIAQTVSSFNAEAISEDDKELVGIMQLSKADIKKYKVENPLDVKENLQAGIKKYKDLLEKFGSVETALYAYNAGDKQVDKWLSEGLTFKEFPFKDSHLFVEDVLKNSQGIVNGEIAIPDVEISSESDEKEVSKAKESDNETTETDEVITDFNLSSPIDLGLYFISSEWGDRPDPAGKGGISNHKGIDLAAAEGVPVKAAYDGVVKLAQYSESYGNWVVVEHPSIGKQTIYAHLKDDSTVVKVGDEIKAGQKLGEVGSTGHSFGNHLHFGVSYSIENWDIKYEDPVLYSKELQAASSHYDNFKDNMISADETAAQVEEILSEENKSEEKASEKESATDEAVVATNFDVRYVDGAVSAESINAHLTGLLAGKGDLYVEVGKKHGINPAFIAAIEMSETGGDSEWLRQYNNVGGFIYNGPMTFDSIEESIEYHGDMLERLYINEGLYTVENISEKYAPVGATNDPTDLNENWVKNVYHFLHEMEAIDGGTSSADKADDVAETEENKSATDKAVDVPEKEETESTTDKEVEKETSEGNKESESTTDEKVEDDDSKNKESESTADKEVEENSSEKEETESTTDKKVEDDNSDNKDSESITDEEVKDASDSVTIAVGKGHSYLYSEFFVS